jgi:hypothetical protein
MKMANHSHPENRIDFDRESRYSMAFHRKAECPSTTSPQNKEDSSSGSGKIELTRKALRILEISEGDFIFCKCSRVAKIDQTLFICPSSAARGNRYRHEKISFSEGNSDQTHSEG